MEWLRAGLVRAGQARLQDWAGLKPERVPVLAGGLAIMMAAFQELGIDRMRAGDGALRIGVLHDLLGRDSHQDMRDDTVRQMHARYQLDRTQSNHVRTLALHLFDQLDLESDPDSPDLRRALGWTADLHEVGLAIARSDYHKHSAYILEHADMPGFSRDDQRLLSFLALGHQGRLAKVRDYMPDRARWLTLCCLRLAVLLLRRREPLNDLPLHLKSRHQHIALRLPAGWLAARPLSGFQLKKEAAIWRKAGFALDVIEA
jgi:exopolyphosphatase/guanosine-5'-triphosphate,3'-diphosphate pyrophosphatase